MARILTSISLLVLAASLASAGELEPVQLGAVYPFPQGYQSFGEFRNAPAGAGTQSPHAVVASADGLKVAIDSKTADGPANVLRLDFSGKGHFADAPSLPLNIRQSGQNASARFLGTMVKATINGKTVPLRVSCYYRKNGQDRTLAMMLQWAAEGTCTFGEKTYPVRVYYSGLGADGKPLGVAINTDGTGKKNFGDDAILAFMDQPVRVGGAFYKMTVDGWNVSAAPAQVETATVKIPAERWRIRGVHNRRMPVIYQGGREAAVIPAGRYKIEEYQVYGEGKSHVDHDSRTGPELAAPAGKTTEWKLGWPLTAEPTISGGSGQVTFGCKLTDAVGLSVTNVYGKDGKRVSPPGVEIRDAGGKVIHTGKLAYG